LWWWERHSQIPLAIIVCRISECLGYLNWCVILLPVWIMNGCVISSSQLAIITDFWVSLLFKYVILISLFISECFGYLNSCVIVLSVLIMHVCVIRISHLAITVTHDSKISNDDSKMTQTFRDTTIFVTAMMRKTFGNTSHEYLWGKHVLPECLEEKHDLGRAANCRQGGTESWDYFQDLVNVPEFCPWDLRWVPGNDMVLIIHPMRILVRIVLNYRFLEIISRFCGIPQGGKDS